MCMCEHRLCMFDSIYLERSLLERPQCLFKSRPRFDRRLLRHSPLQARSNPPSDGREREHILDVTRSIAYDAVLECPVSSVDYIRAALTFFYHATVFRWWNASNWPSSLRCKSVKCESTTTTKWWRVYKFNLKTTASIIGHYSSKSEKHINLFN